MENGFQQCLEKAIDYLSRRDHSSKELREKLKKKNFENELIEKTLEWISERGYLRPPQELSNSLSNLLSRNGKGKLYILQYIKKKGLPPPDNLDSEHELNTALDLALRILKQKNIVEGSPIDRSTRDKIGRKLMSRGFPLDIVRKIIFEKI